MKKFLLLLLCAVLCVGMLQVTAFAEETYVAEVGGMSYTSLAEAITNAGSGDTVTLLENVVLDAKLAITKSLVLDLNGKTISYSGNQTINCQTSDIEVTIKNGTISTDQYYAVCATAGTVNLIDCAVSAKLGYAVYNGGATLTLDGCTVTTPDIGLYVPSGSVSLVGSTVDATSSGSYGVYMKTGAQFTLDADSTLTANGIGIAAFGSDMTISVYGTITGNNYYGVVTNGSSSYSGNTINVYEGAQIIATGNETYTTGYGIYAPTIDSTTNIYGGTITASGTGIEVRAGTLNISGGTITSTAETLKTQANGNGTTVIGAAVAVSQHTTNDDIAVTITGGTLSGVCAVYETDLQDESTDNVELDISGGTFEGTTSAVSSENCEEFISGGAFSTDISEYVIEDKLAVSVTSGGDVTYYVGTDATEAVAGASKGDTVTIINASENTELTNVPVGVTVINTSDSAVKVNGTAVAANGRVTIVYHDTVTIEIGGEQEDNNSGAETNPNTGAPSFMGAVVAVAVLSLGGIILSKRK